MDASPKIGLGFEERQETCVEHGSFTSRAVSIGGRVMPWSKCPSCGDAARLIREAEEAAHEAQERQRRMESRLNKAGIPIRYRNKDFASYIAETDRQEKALALAMEFASNFKEHAKVGTTAVFSGLPGTGKSHLAIAIAQEVMKSTTVLYTSAIDAVRMIRDTWRKDSQYTESQVLAELAGVGLLILDEVGVQYGTEAEQVSLFDIIDKRYRDLMPMILLTNLNKSGMKTFLGDRSFDRLRESGSWTAFEWESGRPKAAV